MLYYFAPMNPHKPFGIYVTYARVEVRQYMSKHGHRRNHPKSLITHLIYKIIRSAIYILCLKNPYRINLLKWVFFSKKNTPRLCYKEFF